MSVVLVLAHGDADLAGDILSDLEAGGVRGVLQSAELLFFAFAGYARSATLREEVRDPGRTIPRAILRGVIGFSSFGVLVYYAVANAAAYTQPVEHRRWPRLVNVVGFAGA